MGVSSMYKKIQKENVIIFFSLKHISFTQLEIYSAMEEENEKLKLENLFLKEKISILEKEMEKKEDEIKNKHHENNNNRREKFIDTHELILQNNEYKKLNEQMTIACEDIRRENEIILEDYRKLQLINDQLQIKYNDAIEENTNLKNNFMIVKSKSNERKSAAQKPPNFFESSSKNGNEFQKHGHKIIL